MVHEVATWSSAVVHETLAAFVTGLQTVQVVVAPSAEYCPTAHTSHGVEESLSVSTEPAAQASQDVLPLAA